jgi:hypothetical protein
VAPETDYLSPKFIRALREKCFSYVLTTERWHDAQGKRVDPKTLVNDPVFRAIHYLRESWLAQITYQEIEGDSPGLPLSVEVDQYQAQRLAAHVFQAVGAFDPRILRRLADLMELNERARAKYDVLLRSKDVVLPWEYYAGMAALSYLINGAMPTKEDVKGLAIKLRAQTSLPVRTGTKALTEKISEVRKQDSKQWRRIFRKLNLTGLPQR